MLPSAKSYLVAGGLSPERAAYSVIGGFLGGVIGIQLLSRLMHRFIPSHVVDCDHTHEEHEPDHNHDEPHHSHGHTNGHAPKSNGSLSEDTLSEDTPLLSRETFQGKPWLSQRSVSAYRNGDVKQNADYLTTSSNQRPTFQTRLTGLVSGRKTSCEQNGSCHGYSDPCAAGCFKAISSRTTQQMARIPSTSPTRGSPLLRTTTDPRSRSSQALSDDLDIVDHRSSRAHLQSEDTARTIYRGHSGHLHPDDHGLRTSSEAQPYDPESNRKHGPSHEPIEDDPPNEHSEAHHHHVPTNAFLSIGLQTSIAIALHKLPEGFITYATNHANPSLGFTVFMALFIHNITEGYAMALPLYLAINSRWKAMFWSSLLGGVSQPLGAGVAALWFKAAGRGDMAPGEIVYGCMFAIIAGIMASVALQLFSESLTLSHNRTLCIAFAFLGMAILGFSFALTAS